MKFTAIMESFTTFHFFILLTLPSITTTNEDIPECVSGWKRQNNTCYKAFNTNTTWSEASSRCEALNGSLPIILSNEENSFLSKMELQANWVWIGASRCRQVDFCWPDGSTVPSTAAWRKGEPNNDRSSESCVEMSLESTKPGKWNDIPCRQTRPFICTRGLPIPARISEIIHSNHSSVIALWNQPVGASAKASQYFIIYREENGNYPTTLTVPSYVTRAHITGLKMATKYVIRLKTGNAAGNSSLSPEMSFITSRLSGSPPTIIDVSDFRILREGDSGVDLVVLCTVTGTTPFTFDWFLENELLKKENSSFQSSSKLVLSGNLKKYLGEITCRVTNSEGVDSKNTTIHGSNAEDFSLLKIRKFQVVLGLLIALAAILIILFVIYCLRKGRSDHIPHIKAESLKIKAPRNKDYADPPNSIQLKEINEVQHSKKENVSNQPETGYYTSLQRNEDGTLIGDNPDVQNLRQDRTYANVDSSDDLQDGYPNNDLMFSNEFGQPDADNGFVYSEDYPADGLVSNVEEGYPIGDHGHQEFSEGRDYPVSDQAFVDEGGSRGLTRAQFDAGSYERLGNIAQSYDPNQSQSPVYGNCTNDDELPIYTNC